MEKKVFRVGSVGIGGISRGVHLPGIEKSPDLRLTAVCDLKPERMAYAREKYGVPEANCFSDYRDLVNCPDVDVVDISTSNNAHFAVAKAAIEAGKPYCIEKPVTLTAEEADILARMTAERGLPSMVCFSYRFKAAARYARELVEQGMLGEIYHVYMQYLQAGGGPSYDLPRSWRYQKALTGTGALGDLGCHALDLVGFVTGKGYRRAVGHADTFVHSRRLEEGEGMGPVDVDDFCHYLMEMDGKTAANFSVTRFAYGRGNYQRMEIYGSKGALVYSLDVTPGVDALEVCIGAPYERVGAFTNLLVPERFRADQMQAFADVLNGCGDGTAATIEDGRRIQHALDTIIRSAEEARWLPCGGQKTLS